MKKYYLLLILLCSLGVNAQALKDYIAYAIENNPTVQQTNYQQLASEEQVKASGWLPDTQIGLGGFISPVATRLGDQRFKVSVNQGIPWFGTLSTMRAQSSFTSKAIAARHQLTIATIIRSVKDAYFKLILLKRNIEVYENQLDLWGQLEQQLLEKAAVGESNLSNILRVKVKKDALQTELENSHRSLAKEKKNFNLLLNKPMNALITIEDDFPMDAVLEKQAKSSLTNHPQTKALQHRYEAMKKAEILVAKNGMPQFNIGLNYINVAERGIASLQDDGRDILMPTLGIKVPIFSKKYRYGKRRIQAQQRALVAAEQKVVNQLETKHQDAFITLQNLQKRYETILKNQRDVAQIIALSNIAYQHKNEDFTDLIAAYQMDLNLKLKALKTQQSMASSAALLTFLKTQSKD